MVFPLTYAHHWPLLSPTFSSSPCHTSCGLGLGVAYLPAAGKWQAQITLSGGKSKYLGIFTDEHEAARAYDRYGP